MMLRLITIVLLIANAIPLSVLADPIVDGDCNQVGTCESKIDCTVYNVPHDERNCRACLLRSPKVCFLSNCTGGQCIQEGNDPFCEAQKAAQNSAYAAAAGQQKAACESAKAAEKATCEARVAGFVASCRVAKGPGNGDAYEALLGNNSLRRPLPEDVVSRLTGSGFYHADVVENISVSPVSATDIVPNAFASEPTGFTIGNRVFLRNYDQIDNLALKFWVTQVETSMMFSEYGVSTLGKVLNDNPQAIFSLISEKVAKSCGVLGC
ncbi:hypothetical protein [Mesorhizobium huakuii]|uniref:Uncharacterized protein n=1 Tax=Mesorhizobium huakuii TaxID=28104 RepID=A0ABZ0VSP1_9HYPH|nr:hypothetical protein [Mesorhizobium huakuii]WQC00508.1 hypothetical protein U0R22_004715 [Mesorhizobium huakuii]